jgi:hypothetical protein
MSATITDEFMQQMLARTSFYSLVILRAGPKMSAPDARKIIWEHGRRNFQLRADGLLAIVCPTVEAGELVGICIFNADLEQTRRVMDDDPAVQAAVLTYEIHQVRGFAKDFLPEAARAAAAPGV